MKQTMQETSAHPSARGLLAPSSRSAIDPFVVMDVMREANARQAAGGDIIHMEVGQPGTPAPRLVREAVGRELGRSALGYTDALGQPELRERIARHYGEPMGWMFRPRGSSSRRAPPLDLSLPFSLCSIRATGWPCRSPAIPATARSHAS